MVYVHVFRADQLLQLVCLVLGVLLDLDAVSAVALMGPVHHNYDLLVLDYDEFQFV